MRADTSQIVHDLGDASFYLYEYNFKETNLNGMRTLQPQSIQGSGNIYQVEPAEGIFLSTGKWTPYKPMERKYKITNGLIKIFYLESGDVTLIQNGKKANPFSEGIHLYLNKPSQGRVLYKPNVPISYVSILLFEDFIEKHLQEHFTPEDFDYGEIYDWKTSVYNTPEIGTLFLQIRNKLIAGETSKLYYESKVGELLSIITANVHKEQRELNFQIKSLSMEEYHSLESARQAIEQNILNPPEIIQLCKIAAMGKTKFREAFKNTYNVPIGTYIRQAKMRYALLLLENPNLTIDSISTHLGYANPSKFSAAFRKIYSQSPKEYRNRKK